MGPWEQIDARVRARVRDAAATWWDEATAGPFERERFLAAFSGAGRRLGRECVAEPLRGPAAEDLGVQARPWAELGRIGLLLSMAARVPEPQHLAIVDETYRTGDLSEKQAVLRALCVLPHPARLLGVAAEGARANAMAVVEAITCDNPYPARFFPADAFNQLVMKALFNALPLGGIVGLSTRLDADLIRMARDYGRERRAAGRPISADLAWLEGETAAS